MTYLLSEPPAAPPERGGDAIYQTLRQLIVSAALPARTRLVEEDLARQFSTSRTPVREALRRLEYDGLVRVLRRGHLESVGISDDEREHLHRLRLAFDLLGVDVLFDRDVEPDWGPALESAAGLGEVAREHGVESVAYAMAHLRVHGAIHAACFGGPIMTSIGQQLVSYSSAGPTGHPDAELRSPVEQHLALVEALRSGDRHRARGAVELHARLGYAVP